MEGRASGALLNRLIPAPTSIPTLTAPAGPATTPETKCDALNSRFLPPVPSADLSDIHIFMTFVERYSQAVITVEENASAISKAKTHKAVSPDFIPVFVLELLVRPLLEYL